MPLGFAGGGKGGGKGGSWGDGFGVGPEKRGPLGRESETGLP